MAVAQFSPGLRSALVAMEALAPDACPTGAVCSALANTEHEVKVCSAAALGRLHALGDDAPGGLVRPLWPTG